MTARAWRSASENRTGPAYSGSAMKAITQSAQAFGSAWQVEQSIKYEFMLASFAGPSDIFSQAPMGLTTSLPHALRPTPKFLVGALVYG